MPTETEEEITQALDAIKRARVEMAEIEKKAALLGEKLGQIDKDELTKLLQIKMPQSAEAPVPASGMWNDPHYKDHDMLRMADFIARTSNELSETGRSYMLSIQGMITDELSMQAYRANNVTGEAKEQAAKSVQMQSLFVNYFVLRAKAGLEVMEQVSKAIETLEFAPWKANAHIVTAQLQLITLQSNYAFDGASDMSAWENASDKTQFNVPDSQLGKKQIVEPGENTSSSLLTLPEELLKVIVANVGEGESNLLAALSPYRAVSKKFESIFYTTNDAPEIAHARTSLEIFCLAHRRNNSPDVFKSVFEKYVSKNPHIRIDLTVIPDTRRRDILKVLEKSTNLVSLDLRASFMPELAPEIIQTLEDVHKENKSLKELKLNLSYDELVDEQIKRLSNLLKTTVLHLTGNSTIDSKAFEDLSELCNLRNLNLAATKGAWTEPLIALADKLPNLVDLNVGFVPSGDPNKHKSIRFDRISLNQRIVAIGKFENLKFLDVSGDLINNANLDHLSKLRQLETLIMDEVQLIPHRLGLVATKLNKVKKLDISHNKKMGDKGIAHVAKISQLNHLYAKGCEITGVRPLATLKLQTLDLNYNRLDNESIKDLLPLAETIKVLKLKFNAAITHESEDHLKKFSQVRELDLRDTRIARDQKVMDRIAAALPNLTRFNGEPYIAKTLTEALPSSISLSSEKTANTTGRLPSSSRTRKG